MRRITDASEDRSTSGSVKPGRRVKSSSSYSRMQTPDATRPQLGRRRADPLDLELFDLAAIAVPFDPRQSGIDHEADAGDGERGLGDVRREHDAAPGMRLEDALLLLRRQSSIEREDFGLW